MNYIIDGHNLIGKIEDIQLSDPDDEAKLVLRLINWAAMGENRRVIVVFDGGVPGNLWSSFKSITVRPVFVPQHDSADRWIIDFISNIKDRQAFHIVTSDRAILKQADNRRIPFTLSESFAKQISAERAQLSAPKPPAEPRLRPLLREHELDAWLQIFGGEPKIEVKPYQPRKKPEPEPTPSAEPATPPPATDPNDFVLTPNEVAEWLALFGGEKNIVTIHESSIRAKRKPGKDTSTIRPFTPPPDSPQVDPNSKLSQEDVDLWHSIFGTRRDA